MRIDNTFAKYGSIVSTGKVTDTQTIGSKQNTGTDPGLFSKILEQSIKQTGVTFSKHAQIRMSERDISLSDSEYEKLNAAVKAAEEKGVSDTLVLMNNKAFIVNVQSNVVVTALKDEDMQGNVFTKIDGAVIL
jgi:flagellar operon protein